MPAIMKLRPVVQQSVIAYRTEKNETFWNMATTIRASCCFVSVCGFAGLSSPMPSVVAR